MSRAERLLFNYLAPAAALDLNGVAADTVTGGSTLDMRLVKSGSLSSLVVVDCETDTMTMEAVWQVSNDTVTWYICPTKNNAPVTVLATGTAGADATVSRVIPADDAVYGFRYARLSIINRVAVGGAADTYLIGYNFEKDDLLP